MNYANIKDADIICCGKHDSKGEISQVFKSSEMKTSFTELAQQYKIYFKM